MDSKFITYAHQNDPDGQRMRQLRSDPLPVWAVDVKPEPPKRTAAELRELAKCSILGTLRCSALPYLEDDQELKDAVRVQFERVAKFLGHEPGHLDEN